MQSKVASLCGKRPSITVDNIEPLTETTDDQQEVTPTEQETEVEIVKPKKLCLRYNINDGVLHQAVKNILKGYAGIDSVFIKDTGSNQAFKLKEGVMVRESLIFELETILNKDDIVVI